MIDSTYVNHLDVDFIEHGGLWVKHDRSTNYHLFAHSKHPDDNDMFVVDDCYVDVADDWINWRAVASFVGRMPETDDLKAVAVYHYYGHPECGSQHVVSRDKFYEMLTHRGISFEEVSG